jgi:hypothetical protein
MEDLKTAVIPDLWHLYVWAKKHDTYLKNHIGHNHLGLQNILQGKPADAKWSQAIHDTWFLAIKMQKELQKEK